MASKHVERRTALGGRQVDGPRDPTVDGSLKSGDHQLRLAVYPIIYRVSAPSQVVGNGISAINSISTWVFHIRTYLSN